MAKKREPEITEEQRQKIEMRKRLLFTICETKEELQQFIKTFLRLDLPDCTVDEMSTSNPMESVWQIYCTMKTNKGAHRVVVAASRNSMKTVMSAVIHWLAMVHFRRSCLQIAAIKDQSYKAIKYLKKFLRIPELQDHFETNRAGELRLSNLPSNSYTAKDDADVFVTAATLEGANSSRASIIIRDECDLTPREILSEVAMVADPTQDEHGFEPITISLSSRKTSQGPLQELMEEAEKGDDKDIRLDKWSAVDFMKKCLPETHGEKRLKAYLHTENLKVRWDEEAFQEEPEAVKVKYKEILAYEGCVTCPAFIACQARAPKQTSKSKTLRTIAFTGNFIKETKEANKIIAQILNWRPETGGLVFPTLNRGVHVRNIEETWFWVTGQQWKATRKCTKQDIYAWAVTNKWEVSFGIDWGVRDSAVVVVILYSQTQTRAVVLHVRAATGYPNSQWAQTIREKECLMFPPDIICPDMADAGSTHYFQPFGFAVKPKKPTHIETGVVQIQSLLWNVERQENDIIFCKAENDSGMEYAIDSMANWMHKKDPRGEFDTSRFEDDDNTHACFTAGHKVITTNGAINIEDVQPNDLVLTHKGRFRRVKAVMSRDYTGELIEINPYGRETILCTPEHPFYSQTYERSYKKENEVRLTGQLRKTEDACFKPAKLFKKVEKNGKLRDSVLFGVEEPLETFDSFDMSKLLPEWKKHSDTLLVSRRGLDFCDTTIEFDKYMAFAHGHFAAEGSCSQSKKTTPDRTAISWAIHQKEEIVHSLYLKIAEKFHIKNVYLNQISGLGSRIFINSKPMYSIFKPFGAKDEKKYPEYIYRLSQENTWYVLLGHAFGDGHYSATGLMIPTISKHLAYQLLYLMQKVGLKPKIRIRNCIGRWGSIGLAQTFTRNQYVIQLDINDTYQLIQKTQEDEMISSIYKEKTNGLVSKATMPSNKIKTDGIYSSMFIKSVSTKEYSGRVYTLSVEEDESYTVNGVAVQNCDALRYGLDKYRTAVEVRISSKKVEAAPLSREEAYKKEMESAMYETYKDMGVPMMPSQLAEKTIEAYQRAGMGHLVDGNDNSPTPEPKKKLIRFSF